MRASAFSPSHITGFFQIFRCPDELKTGSRGCGVVINQGTRTDVRVEDSDANEIKIFVNAKPCDCPVTGMAADEMLKLADGTYKVEISQSVDVPIKYGFGASASGALSTGLALNEALDLNLTETKIGQVAHFCEIKNMTGLGDVMAEFNGGLVIRLKEGAPGIGRVSKIPCDDFVVAFIIGEELETKAVLKDEIKKKRINNIGRLCLNSLLKAPDHSNFLRLSKKFAVKTGLLNKKVKGAMVELERQGVASSMIMLGNSLFTITDDPERVSEMLDYKYIIADIDHEGARLI
ncbi:MAG: pantoate kinase [Candidatus Hydrothermarchaeales archaeon]